MNRLMPFALILLAHFQCKALEITGGQDLPTRDDRDGLFTLRGAFSVHQRKTGTIARTWEELKQYLEVGAFERILKMPMEEKYVIMTTPTSLTIRNTEFEVLLAERNSVIGRNTQSDIRGVVILTKAGEIASTTLRAYETDDLVAAAIAAGGENKSVAIKTAPEIPPPPIAPSPPDGAGRYLKFLLWLACLAIMAVIGVTIGRSCYDKKDKQ